MVSMGGTDRHKDQQERAVRFLLEVIAIQVC